MIPSTLDKYKGLRMVKFHDQICFLRRASKCFMLDMIGSHKTWAISDTALTQHFATYGRVGIVVPYDLWVNDFKLMNRHNFWAIMVIIAKERKNVTLLPFPPCVLMSLCRMMSEREIFTSIFSQWRTVAFSTVVPQ